MVESDEKMTVSRVLDMGSKNNPVSFLSRHVPKVSGPTGVMIGGACGRHPDLMTTIRDVGRAGAMACMVE